MGTRHGVAAALGVVNQSTSNPSGTQWKAVKRIPCYLKGSKGYVDADWAGDVNTWKNQSEYIFKLCGGPIRWVSKKQGVVALSTTQAESISASFVAQ